MTVQPTLFAADADEVRKCWWCRKPTRHETLHTFPNGIRQIRCRQCNAGGTTR